MKDQILYPKAYSFAVRVVKAYKYLTSTKREFVIAKQLLKSGTSIGANIAEANGAISQDDFSHKMSLAYKDCLETMFWLFLLKDTGFINSDTFESMNKDADELSRILFSILKTTRIKKRQSAS
jgi:four helix bundle protein